MRDDLEPVHLRHEHIRDDEIMGRCHRLQRVIAIGRLGYVMAGGFEQAADSQAHRGLIVDNEYLCHCRSPSRLVAARHQKRMSSSEAGELSAGAAVDASPSALVANCP